jgi:hypothetical protein
MILYPGLVGTYSGNLPINETLQRILDEPKYSIWIFAYGSLCWNPGFEVRDRVYGHISGYSRKFWQGDSTYRGTPEQFGRTATLIKEVHLNHQILYFSFSFHSFSNIS